MPLGGLVYSAAVSYPTPRNLNYWWTFGGILTFMLVAQIITGVVLVMHFIPHVDHAFNSVETIMRDVNYGWLLRYLHASGASMFFVAVYVHMARGMYYGSYKEPREVPPARLFASFNRRDQLAARRLTLPSASEVSLASVFFSSSSVCCRMLAQSLRPSCRAHAIRLP